MTDTTQPKPGRALDEAMAEVMGWPMLEPFSNWGEKFPCAARGDLGDDLGAWIYDAPRLAREWNPSTRIADAFEVMGSHEEFQWTFGETGLYLSVVLSAPDLYTTGTLTIPWSDFTDPDGTRNRQEAYSFGICWAALVWLEEKNDSTQGLEQKE